MLNVEILDIFLAGSLCGKLFRFNNGGASVITRFVPDQLFIRTQLPRTLSLSMQAEDVQQQMAFWNDVTHNTALNGVDGRLPVFFQNMLPEGLFRTQLAQERGCKENDHFALLAACGLDLPGAITALPAHVSRDELAQLVTQGHDALEMSVTADPLPLGVSISGMQPKLGLIERGGRYVARRRDGITRIIGKLPQADRPLLPEVEHLSLLLASAAGAKVCEHKLVPLAELDFSHHFMLGGSNQFLAVTRFDRAGERRIHCEDFAQALGVDPQNKYTGATYTAMAALMMSHPATLGIPAVHELLRLITINELLGNYDGHLKNFCLIYPDGQHPVLAPAFDIVAWSVYISGQGNGLAMYREADSQGAAQTRKSTLSPYSLRRLCNLANVPEKPCSVVVRETARKARALWPPMIEASGLTALQKERLLERLKSQLSSG
jgi:serine/threonine-protein kinase HipA